MKILSFIMSFLLLVISCLPCGDSIECNQKKLPTIAATANDQEHEHSTEACSPFCSCSCCAASIVVQQVAKNLPLKPFVGIQKFTIQNDFFISQEFSSIWQPPKLS